MTKTESETNWEMSTDPEGYFNLETFDSVKNSDEDVVVTIEGYGLKGKKNEEKPALLINFTDGKTDRHFILGLSQPNTEFLNRHSLRPVTSESDNENCYGDLIGRSLLLRVKSIRYMTKDQRMLYIAGINAVS